MDDRELIADCLKEIESSNPIIIYGYSLIELSSKPLLLILIPVFFDYLGLKKFYILNVDKNCASLFKQLLEKSGNPNPDEYYNKRIQFEDAR